ncbi:MAG TPA: HlyD family efflux transporter periplasmic adaptor subunit [Balneolaceae bacterium]|nr:HlyD family efflux transporter periplasmic adaptor subunit [Balneolaceae bacterium]
MKLRYGIILQLLFLEITMLGCSSKQKNNTEEPVTVAEVQVTHIKHKTLADTLTVNGRVLEGQQFKVRAPLAGYVTHLYVRPGEQVRAGQQMFSMRTREQTALAQDTATAGTSLSENSAVAVKAPVDGQISTISTGKGVYTAEGSSMATLNSRSNLYMEIYVPAQWGREVQPGDSAFVQWPDGRKRWAKIGSRLAQADSASQSVKFMVNDMPPRHLLPGERLTVQVPVNKVVNEQVLPRKAVLTDESMSSWWVMKMANDSTAVRVQVTPGIASGNWMAVPKPEFQNSDQILVQGNYGLADTARVKVTNQ